jgi:hypothetical protein
MYDVDKFEHTVGKEIVNELTFSECKDRLKEYLWDKYDKREIFENPSIIVESMEEKSVRKSLIYFIDEEESIKNENTTKSNDDDLNDLSDRLSSKFSSKRLHDKEIYDIAKKIYINLLSNDINKMYSTEFNPVKYSIQAAQRFVKFYNKNL